MWANISSETRIVMTNDVICTNIDCLADLRAWYPLHRRLLHYKYIISDELRLKTISQVMFGSVILLDQECLLEFPFIP